MSFDINWSQLVSDGTINESIKGFLDEQFQNLSLPSYIDNLSVTDFNLGNIAPEITIRHIGDPFDEFYEKDDDGEDENASGSENENNNNKNTTFNNDKGTNDPNDTLLSNQNDTNSLSDDEENSTDDSDSSSDEDEFNSTKNDELKNPPTHIPNLKNTRMALDSFFQIHNNLNHIHTYNMNNVGLGTLNNSSTHTGTDTPSSILNQNPYSTLRNSQSLSKPGMKNTHPLISKQKKSPLKDDNDIQFILEISYHGDIHMEITVNLLVNYPSLNFISLPIKLHISDLTIHSIAAIAYLKHAVFFSFLCDINETNSDYFSSSHGNSMNRPPPSTSTPAPGSSHLNFHHQPDLAGSTNGGNFVDYISGPTNSERIDIIKKVKIESEIGEVENNALRNVGKVERFLIEQLRNIIRDEIAWPGWLCFDLNDDDEDENNNEDENDSDD